MMQSSSSDAWACSAVSCRGAQAGDPDEAGQIEYQRDGAVSEDRRSRDALDVPVIGLERLDDDLLLAEEVVHEQTDAPPVPLHHDDESLVQLARAGLHAEDLVQADHGQVV